ncbi:MAG: hypothetical protein OXI38_04925 [Bacteroidota bacterium]|nr:hypothetical protein [Bacteroidota bacterium]
MSAEFQIQWVKMGACGGIITEPPWQITQRRGILLLIMALTIFVLNQVDGGVSSRLIPVIRQGSGAARLK